jgi:hypothetical protein
MCHFPLLLGRLRKRTEQYYPRFFIQFARVQYLELDQVQYSTKKKGVGEREWALEKPDTYNLSS